jgi:hypothetical protein
MPKAQEVEGPPREDGAHIPTTGDRGRKKRSMNDPDAVRTLILRLSFSPFEWSFLRPA